jgi:hypothetical protein
MILMYLSHEIIRGVRGGHGYCSRVSIFVPKFHGTGETLFAYSPNFGAVGLGSDTAVDCLPRKGNSSW